MKSIHATFYKDENGMYRGTGSQPGHPETCPCRPCQTVRSVNVLNVLLGMESGDPEKDIGYSKPKPDRDGRLAMNVFVRQRPARA